MIVHGEEWDCWWSSLGSLIWCQIHFPWCFCLQTCGWVSSPQLWSCYMRLLYWSSNDGFKSLWENSHHGNGGRCSSESLGKTSWKPLHGLKILIKSINCWELLIARKLSSLVDSNFKFSLELWELQFWNLGITQSHSLWDRAGKQRNGKFGAQTAVMGL